MCRQIIFIHFVNSPLTVLNTLGTLWPLLRYCVNIMDKLPMLLPSIWNHTVIHAIELGLANLCDTNSACWPVEVPVDSKYMYQPIKRLTYLVHKYNEYKFYFSMLKIFHRYFLIILIILVICQI